MERLEVVAVSLPWLDGTLPNLELILIFVTEIAFDAFSTRKLFDELLGTNFLKPICFANCDFVAGRAELRR